MKEAFRSDIEEIRRRAREKMMDVAVTDAYRADVEQVTGVLQEVLATEIVCTLRYKNHYYMATGFSGQAAAGEFLEHMQQEQEHADWVAERITQLGGNTNLDPDGLLTRAHAQYSTSDSLVEMSREDLVAERVAIETYSEIIRWLGDDDPTTRRLMEDILKVEEEHADDMVSLLERVGGPQAMAAQ